MEAARSACTYLPKCGRASFMSDELKNLAQQRGRLTQLKSFLLRAQLDQSLFITDIDSLSRLVRRCGSLVDPLGGVSLSLT
jgi:hypothetical protein